MTSSSTGPMRLGDLQPRHRRRVFIRASSRSLLLVVAVVALYFVWPEGGTPDSTLEWATLAVGMAAFILVFVWELGQIASSRVPEARAIEALAVVATLFVVMVSTIYLFIDGQPPGSFSEPLTRMGALYFTVAVLTTVGFGDISPVTDGARAVVTAQMVLNAVFIGVLVKVILGAAQATLRRDDPAPEGADGDGPGGSTG
ncbi:MAG: potassium channel family protein [Actinomycetota bacterium]|nr:potassium channel family protein [Actinomycetota bacterium]MDH4015873.1 potassium channel family protein [Actinomycetota bacterium]